MARLRRIRRGQKIKNRTWKRWALSTVIVLFILAVGCIIGGYYYLRAYLQSEDFRDKLEKEMASELNVDEVRMPVPEWDGAGIRCPEMLMSGKEYLETLRAKDISLKFGRMALLRRKFVIESLSLSSLNLGLREGQGLKSDSVRLPKNWLEEHILPNDVSFRSGHIDNLSISYGSPDKIYTLKNSVLNGFSENDEQFKFEFAGGTLRLPFAICSEWNLQNATVYYQSTNHRTTLSACRLNLPSGAYADIKGKWDGRVWDGNLIVCDVPLSTFLDGKEYLQGKLKASSKEFEGTQEGVTKMKGKLSVTQASLSGLPLLDRLARFCDSPLFRQISFQKAESDFTYDSNGWHFPNIRVESEVLGKLEGEFGVSPNNMVHGRLRIGLRANGPWCLVPGVKEVFSASAPKGEEGLIWANVNLGGTIDDVTEDLSARLMKAATERIVEKGSQVVSGGVDMLNQLIGTKNDERQEKEENASEEESSSESLIDHINELKEQGEKAGNVLKSLFNF